METVRVYMKVSQLNLRDVKELRVWGTWRKSLSQRRWTVERLTTALQGSAENKETERRERRERRERDLQ
jgi:hypothetical protein